MTIEELYVRLCEEGFGHLIVPRADGFSLIDVAIERDGGMVRICERERGHVISVLLETDDETLACRDYLRFAECQSLRLLSSHDKAEILACQRVLGDNGISAERNDIPNFDGGGNALFRLFVWGRDLKAAWQAIGDHPAGLSR